MDVKLQNRDGLAASILEERRFFELCGSSKTSLPSNWNNPKNWKYIDEIPEGKFFGFAIGNQSNYLFIDADHVIKNGVMIPWVKAIFDHLLKIAPTYWEYSMSNTGWHMVCDLRDYADSFPRTANGYTEIIIDMNPSEYEKLPKEKKETIPKIEMFYHTAGRYVYLTGKNDETIEVAKDEDAAAIFHELLKTRDKYHHKHGWTGSGADTSDAQRIGNGRYHPNDETKHAILEALPYISANARETWVTVGIALSNCGFPFEVWDEWSKWTDQRNRIECDKYSANETPVIWKSFLNTSSRYGSGTIFRLAKERGWNSSRGGCVSDPARDFAREVKSTEPRGDPEKPLPEVVSFEKVSGNIPPLKPEIIKGILREGHKMLLAGQSKAGKSFDLIELALCFASGGSWHGFQCEKTKVLYVNMEIDAASFFHRVEGIAEKMQLSTDAIGDRLKIWNLRGQGAGIASLVEPLKKVSAGCGAVIIDPIYKVMEGDENNASEMAAFTKNLDKVAEGGAAVIFAHHFGKNTQGVYKDPMNRASGSGVFARDPDAIITMSSLEEISVTPEIRESAGVSGTASCFQLDFTLREFPPVRPLKIWFDYPIHIIDNGSLSGVCVNGAKKTMDERQAVKIAVLDKAFVNYADQIEDDGGISLKFLDHRVEQIGGKGRTAGEKTIRAYTQVTKGLFYCLNGKLYKRDEPEEYNPFEDEKREIPRNS